jgi:hypothetical protein
MCLERLSSHEWAVNGELAHCRGRNFGWHPVPKLRYSLGSFVRGKPREATILLSRWNRDPPQSPPGASAFPGYFLKGNLQMALIVNTFMEVNECYSFENV